MKKGKKRILIVTMIACIAACGQAVAMEEKAGEGQAIANADRSVYDEGMQIYGADVIVYKYRMYNNKMQYRRWNETQNCWVDPAWIDM